MTDIDSLLKQLHADDTQTRLITIKALQQFDKPIILDELKDLLGDTSPAIVRASVLAIGKMGDCDQIDILVPLLDHESIWVQRATIQAIGLTGCQDAVPVLVRLLGDDRLESLVREALVTLKVDPDFF